ASCIRRVLATPNKRGSDCPNRDGGSPRRSCRQNGAVTWIELEGAVNTRDVGGLPTRDGRRVAYRKLLRSDNLPDLTDNDIKLLTGSHGVRTVVDLRTNTERASEGPGPLRAVDHVRHPDLSVPRRAPCECGPARTCGAWTCRSCGRTALGPTSPTRRWLPSAAGVTTRGTRRTT